MVKNGLILVALLAVWTPLPSFAQNAVALKSFLQEANQKKTLKSKASQPSSAQPAVKIHFYWASWCEYCDQAFNSIMTLQRDPSLEGKIQLQGYCLDEKMNDEVQKKIQKMSAIDQFLLPPDSMKKNPELARLPAFIVEDTKTGRLEAYTGFSNERFRYLKRKVTRILRTGAGGDLNEE